MDVTPTRSAVLELGDERRAMHEGYVFLDEKCLLLAAEMLRELERHGELRRGFDAAWAAAVGALQAAVARHGLDALQVHAALSQGLSPPTRETRSLMGVSLQSASLASSEATPPAAVDASPEGEACRRAFARLVALAAPLAALEGNLERLSLEYRRTVRRARALSDVQLPELERDIHVIETRLEELEQEDAIVMRRGR